MDLSKICIGCMTNKGKNKRCPYCGWQEGQASDNGRACLPPRTILQNRYVIGKSLGCGGFGITYLALDCQSGKKIAIKEFMPQKIANRMPNQTQLSICSGDLRNQYEYGMDKFTKEAKILMKLQTIQGIVAFLDLFYANNTAYIVMEYLDGMSLRQYLDIKGGRIKFHMALRILSSVILALAQVHREGMIHRDISPENIYVGFDRSVKLLDFGTARMATAEKTESLYMVIKKGYAPFEQYQTATKQGPWTDVYATAATLYRMLTGRVPLEATSRKDQSFLEPPSAMGIALPAEAENILLKGLAVDSSNRYQNMEEFGKELMIYCK